MATHKITDEIREDLQGALDDCGSLAELSRRMGVPPSYLSRYLSGAIKSVQTDMWLKMCRYLPSIAILEAKDLIVAAKNFNGTVSSTYNAGNGNPIGYDNMAFQSKNAVEDFRRAVIDLIMKKEGIEPELKIELYQEINEL